MTSPRSVVIRSEVCLASGAVPGVTVMTSTPCAGGCTATLVTSGTLASPCASRPSAAVSAADPVCATTSSAPLNPGPKPSASRSYAWRDVVDAGSLLASDEPSRRCSTGRASSSMTTVAAAASTAGRRCTVRAHRAQAPDASASSGDWKPCARSRARCLRLSTRIPRTLSRAGSRVLAASTVQTTVTAAVRAMPSRKSTPRVRMPSRATHTVPPANTTARPEVPAASAAACAGGSPASSPRRCRVTMNSA